MEPLTTDETKQLGECTDALLAKYLPEVGEYGPEIAMVVAVTVIFVPRIIAMRTDKAVYTQPKMKVEDDPVQQPSIPSPDPLAAWGNP